MRAPNIGKLFNILVKQRGYDPTVFKWNLVPSNDSDANIELLYDMSKHNIGLSHDTQRVLGRTFGENYLQDKLKALEFKSINEIVDPDEKLNKIYEILNR